MPSLMSQFQTGLEKLSFRDAPVGMIATFLVGAVPDGWLILNGQKVYQSAYPRLYAKLSTVTQLAKGSDGTGAYVTLPNADGRVLQGTSDLASVGKLMEASLPAITGGLEYSRDDSISATTDKRCFSVFGLGSLSQGFALAAGSSGGAKVAFDAGLANSAYSGSSVQPPSVLTLVAIRY